jgi:probable F420-dependent oxidoreductase
VTSRSTTPTFGVLHDFRRPLPDRGPYAAYYAECLDEVAEADRLGFDAVWLSEHHSTLDGMMPAPLVLAGAIAARTRRIRIGTSILVLPFHHPIRVAEEVAVADLLCGGRLVLGVGQGYAEQEFALFGVDRRHRGALLEEAVEVIRQAWTEDRVCFHGRHWSFDDVAVTPRPERTVPVYVGGVTEAGLRRAARIGDGIIVYCATPRDLMARRALLDSVAGADRVPFVCTSVLHVADDAELAWAEAAPGIAYLEGQIAAYGGRSAAERLDRADYLVGTPDDVAGRLVELHGATGFDHFAHWARLPGLTHERALETLLLVATRVVPAATAAIRGAPC